MSRKKISAVEAHNFPKEPKYELGEAFAYDSGGSDALEFEKMLRAMAYLLEYANEHGIDSDMLGLPFGMYIQQSADHYHKRILPFAERALADRDAPHVDAGKMAAIYRHAYRRAS